MKYFNLRPVKNKKGVYLFYVGTQLAYIGKSSNLINRLQRHLNFELKKNSITESWKTEISKIEYYFCNSLVDCELLETYLISVLKPKYNIDKVYPDTLSLIVSNLPTKYCLEEVEANITSSSTLNRLRLAKKPSFKKLCLEYIQAKEDNNQEVIKEIEISFPLIEEAYKKLGVEKMKALNYRASNFTAVLLNLKITLSMESKIVSILDLKVGQLVDRTLIKKELQNIYTILGINKIAKATDLSQWYTIKEHDKRVQGKKVAMLKIINC